ncbi:MAG: S8 family peptidase [Bacteroidetes bacterium]|nr:S8 family peptidase [Bacteroidota bacterium]MCL2303302.1 S8 family peptidase [Lentimicrobiaceae bacterium]
MFYLICATLVVFSQNRKGSFCLQPNSDKHELYVSFYSDDFLDPENALQIAIDKIDGFQKLVTEYVITLQKGITISDNKLDKFANNAAKNNRSGASIYKLKKIYKVQSLNNDNETLYELAGKLELLGGVEYASLVSLTPIPPPWDIPPTTPNFEYLQTYLEPNPGVDMRHAWSLGLTGEGIRVRDVEYGVNKDHEALNERNVAIASNMDISPELPDAWGEHGTAVFGIVIADDADYGITGMAYGASEMILFPEWQSTGYNRIYAVQRSIEDSDEGDVIIYEMQTGGWNDQYVPAEYNNVVWDLTKAASDAGIIIVAAAGNGNQNLDASVYYEYMARGNSGAIIVGAGSPNLAHAPLWFTTYGSRVDVQGWGIDVFTSGYGDEMQIGGDFNQNYTLFSGTSSATPIVASCVIVLQSYYYSLTGRYMTSKKMRDLLVFTGTPQTGNRHIGPLPNMKKAIEKIDNMLNFCEPITDISVKTNENCLVTISWKAPENIIYPKYNIYKDNVLVAENYTDTLYSEIIDLEEMLEWCVETICEDENPEKICMSNEICKLKVNEMELKDVYTLFPNPVYDRITVKSQILPSSDTKIELLNIYGSLISSHIFTDNEALISLEGLPNGIYFVRIFGNDSWITKKIVKM